MTDELFGFHMPLSQMSLRLGCALALGAMIGWEREAKGRAAGLRTHTLVAVGAAGFTLIGMEFAAASEAQGHTLDFLRLIEAVATGVGFLGAGTIIQSGGKVKGLTTAASIWAVAAVGVAAGAGHLALAGLLTAFSLLTLIALLWTEKDDDAPPDRRSESSANDRAAAPQRTDARSM
jgi:putative Mg2+ transporter-C (MgtC) family protein